MNEHSQNSPQAVAAWVHRFRRKLASFGVGLLACLLGYHVVFGANGLVVYGQKRAAYRQLQEQNLILQQQNEALEQKNKALKTDPQAIAKEAREILRYAKPGEVVYTVQPKPQPSPH